MIRISSLIVLSRYNAGERRIPGRTCETRQDFDEQLCRVVVVFFSRVAGVFVLISWCFSVDFLCSYS